LIRQLPTASPDSLAALVVEERSAVLGRRRLVWPRASGVQWNPADDLCVALDLRIEAAPRLQLSGRVFDVRHISA
jgi:hypothetical protein